MIDLGISKLALIGAVALLVIGPEKLPRVARMAGALLGRAQRYVSDLKAEVNRSIALDELKQAKATLQGAVQDFEQSMRSGASDLEQSLSQIRSDISASPDLALPPPSPPEYRHPKKNWRLKRGALPNWYKAHAGVRSKVLSGAARVARHRPGGFSR